jgi:hypothetical protein
MLGVALSQGARSYLKQMDQGLKHFLSQFPNEFSVDGGKGCEYVTYTPTQLSLSQAIDGFDGGAGELVATRAVGSRSFGGADELGPLTASPKPMAAQLASSPDHPTGPTSATRGINTPSDWGTPYVQQIPGPTQAWVPPWPQGPPGTSSADAAPWGQMPAWPMPPSQFAWNQFANAPVSGWPAYPPWGANPPNLEGGPASASANAAAAFGTAPAGSTAPRTASQDQAPASATASASVRLRGLPFTSAEQDVLAFFAQHDIVDRIADGPKAVNILTRSNGRPSGQAIVQMREPADAELAHSVLHGQWMGSRYIEVFLLTAEENEAQSGQAASTSTAPATSPQKANATSAQEPMSVPMATSALPAGPAAPGASGAVQDLGNQFPGVGAAQGMPPALPPWQLGMWSAAMAGGQYDRSAAMAVSDNGFASCTGMPAPGSADASSWEALFEFLGPESAAAMGMPPLLDFSAMGQGYGLPETMSAIPASGVHAGAPTPNGA